MAGELTISADGVRDAGRKPVGRTVWVSGPVVKAEVERAVFMGEQMEVGDERLIGEVIGVSGDQALLQVYEETEGLGPGLVGSVFDGI